MAKFVIFKVWLMPLNELAGLVSETVVATFPHVSLLDKGSKTQFQALKNIAVEFLPQVNAPRVNRLTLEIQKLSNKCSTLYLHIKRMLKTTRHSDFPDIAAASAKLIAFYQPFWMADKKPILQRMTQYALMAYRYAADPSLKEASETVGIEAPTRELFATNIELQNHYKARLKESEAPKKPAAYSRRTEVIKAYVEFCSSVEELLTTAPTAERQILFDELNNIRHKYHARQPIKINFFNILIAPVPKQPFTGQPCTPIPRVYFRDGKELRELTFQTDFTVQYHYNTKVGEARLDVVGRQKYVGRCITNFQIFKL
ncbi:MAG: DUF6261 family protein [Prevotellaceae bacterium]|jgi:hypothetical protein|nr:DUF6261 family protein [Prevotellaceae bacterium]